MEQEPRPDVAMVDGVLKSVISDASFDGSIFSWEGKKGRVFKPFEFVLDEDTAKAIQEISNDPNAEDLLQILLLRPMLRQMKDSRDPSFNMPIYKLEGAMKKIPSDRRDSATQIQQKVIARTAYEQRKVESERLHLERETFARAESERLRAEKAAVDEKRRLEDEARQRVEFERLQAEKQAERERRRLDFARLTVEEEKFKRAYDSELATMGEEPKPESFRRVGTEGRRRADQLRQDEFARQFAQEKLEEPELAFGDLLEAFMQVELMRQDWFGAQFVRTSKYDDYFNGTDGMLEWPDDRPESSARLAIDFTVAESDEVLRKKCRKIDRGVQIQYFRSSSRDARGRTFEASLSNVPIVILGVDRAMLRKILEETEGDPEKLREHPVRALMVEQAAAQVGLQVREMCARLVGTVIGREKYVSDSLREAVRAYTDGAMADRTYTKNSAEIARIFSQVTEADFSEGFHNENQASRLAQLLRVFMHLDDRRESLREESTPARQWLGESKTHERLARGLAALRLGRFGLFGKFPFLGFPELS